MTKTRLFLAAGAAALLAACGMGADYPEFSQVSYRVEGMTADPNGGAATQTVIYRDGPKMRIEAALPEYGAAVVVFDESTDAAYVLTSTPAVAAVAPSAATVTPNAPAAPSTQTNTAPAAQNGATAAAPNAPNAAPPTGVAVRLDNADAPQAMETVWAALGKANARRVGDCEVAGEQGDEWEPRNSSTGVERTACITNDGIILRVRENDMVLWEATRLERGPQDPNLFGVPTNYAMIDPDAVAEGVGERLDQLDSVTGDDSTPPATQRPRG